MANSLNDQLKQFKDVEFLKYQFTDIQGNIREVTLTTSDITSSGTTSVDGSSVFGKIIPPTESDMLLMPDIETLQVLPGNPRVARVICNVLYPPRVEGVCANPFEGDPRGILTKVEGSVEHILTPLMQKRYPGGRIARFHAHFAPELEFLLLPKEYDHNAIHTDADLQNNNYFVPPQKIVDVTLQDILHQLGLMKLKKEKYHTEVTSYQCEVGIGHGNIRTIADATMTAKDIIEKAAELHGLRASFIPKFRKGVNGSGMHVHQNLAVTFEGNERDTNLFFDEKNRRGISDIGSWYIAGLLEHAREITAITNPRPISYKRLVPGCEAPTYIAWDWQNRTALCRGHSQGTHKVRVEYRAPDPLCNPYLAFAAMLAAGLDGIQRKLPLPKPDKRDFYHDNVGVKELPGNLGDALELMTGSRMLRAKMGDFLIDTLYTLGTNEWKSYSQEVTDVDIRKYL